MARTIKKKRGRGGRPKGTWERVQPAELVAYRQRRGLSRVRLAQLLGVSPTTIVNWELGHGVATPSAQDRLRELLDAPDGAASPVLAAAGGDERADAIEATGRIVVAYLGGAHVDRDALPDLVREVRTALER
ncbi:MAG: helix-turn-helix domain-containing protein [Planctomycetes bacterium]|nr:helix-turn-helix domain-containing protein [Planctomycetota bacterium]